MKTQHIPRKRFGQHFLVDQNILNKIVNVFTPKEGQYIVEIGPGTGALTEKLLDKITTLTAVELDKDLIDHLQAKFGQNETRSFEVIESDILKFDFSSLFKTGVQNQKLRIIGNLPYNISTPLIFYLLEHIDIIEDMVFMLQKEVAMRLSAVPGNKHYGRLTIMSGIDFHCEPLFEVPPTAFNPPPKVDSTVIRMWPRDDHFQINCRESLSKIVTAAFSQRRKTIKNSLKHLVTDKQFKMASIDTSQRAENLRVEDFIALSNISSITN